MRTLLAVMVRALGGRLVTHHWSDDGFVILRRLMGVRLKLVVMLVAEIVGLAYYSLVASSLPRGPMRATLISICADEVTHLRFHADFFACQPVPQRSVMQMALFAITAAATLVVVVDHGSTLYRLGQSPMQLIRRVVDLSRTANELSDTRNERQFA